MTCWFMSQNSNRNFFTSQESHDEQPVDAGETMKTGSGGRMKVDDLNLIIEFLK